MQKIKHNQGFSAVSLLITIIIIAVLGGGYYFYKNNSIQDSQIGGGFLEDLKQAPGLLDGKPIGKNAPTNWSDTLCTYFTLADAKDILGSTAYLPKDAFTANVCGYHIPNGQSEFYEPSASLVITSRSYSSDYSKIMHDVYIQGGAVDVPNISDWVTVSADEKGNARLDFFNNGVLAGISIKGFGSSEKSIGMVKEIAKRVIPRLPQ